MSLIQQCAATGLVAFVLCQLARADLFYTITDLGTLGGSYSAANGINANGQVVGESVTAGGLSHAFLWSDGTMRDLGALDGIGSSAYAVNDRGQIVGQTRTLPTGEGHAFLWTAQDGMRDLGTLEGRNSGAYGINNLGQVVG